MKRLLILLFLVTSVSAIADNYPRDWNVDVHHYRFQLSLSDVTDQIFGEALIFVNFEAQTKSINFDLINETDRKGMRVTGVSIRGLQANYKHENNKLTVSADKVFEKGSSIEIRVTYEGIPQDGLIISKNMFGDRTFFGDNYPDRARHWLPTVDHPSDKATVEWVVNAPERYEVIGSGLKVEQTVLADGMKRTKWIQGVPISTKIMVIGVSRFSVAQSGRLRDVSIESWVYPQNAEEGYFDYSPAADILRFYDSFIGEYPYEKLANVQSKTRYGGMENASNIFYYEGSVKGNQSMNRLLAHEIAHQWFGNSVTEQSWHHAWLSEGITSYFTHVYVEYVDGVDKKRNGLKSDRQKIIAYYKTNPHPIVYTTVTDYSKMLNTNTYAKGSWVLNMLRKKLGDDDFFDGMRNYYRRYRDGNALTDDLKNVMEETSGMELDTFFDQWVYGEGQPNLQIEWRYKGGKLEIEIEQKQEKMFEFDIELLVDGDLIEMSVSDKSSKQVFEVSTEPKNVEVDPYVWLLYEGKIIKI
jgi:aminopeptidase N